MSYDFTAIGGVLLGIAAILVVLGGISAFREGGDGFGDALMWAFYLALGGVVLLCCGAL